MRALVVGGGIAGLAAAIELVDLGHEVEVWEASDTLGGKLRSSRFGGVDGIDEGADAYLTRTPAAVAFAARVGVADLVHPADVHAAIYRNGLHRLPAGTLLGVPTDWRGLATSRLLSWRGKLRATADLVLPRTDASTDTLGSVMRARLGDEVHERLIDALVGSIYATDTDRASLAAYPQLSALVGDSRSLIVGARRRRRPPTGEPIFAAPRAGMAELAAAAERTLVAAGGVVERGRSATQVRSVDGGVMADDERFDGVVIAAPVAAAADMLSLGSRVGNAFEAADIAMVRLLVPDAQWPERLHGMSGYLVPKPEQRLVTAASFGSQKWPHWAADGFRTLRVSLGRDGLPALHLSDDELIAAAVEDVGRQLAVSLDPTEVSVTRWQQAFPQYRPGHLDRVTELERSLPRAVALAGASYHGIGVPACIASGQRAANRLVTHVSA